ncbi:MAG: hypothetical protein B6D46_03535 [Polyangiaceae bacterium UTPRO1]|nr:MAG: hypothetical protein B6D46_03535 [Polyangiaceae bacterium UTPRO1]
MHTVAFSVVPSRSARTCLCPSIEIPEAKRITWSRKCKPSIRIMRTLRASSSGASHAVSRA